MHTTLEDFNRLELAQDKAQAFLVKSLLGSQIGAHQDDPVSLHQFFAARSINRAVASLVTKAVVGALDTSSGLTAPNPLAHAYLETVNRLSVFGTLGTIRVSGYSSIAMEVTAASTHWVGENVSKPLSSFAFAAATMRPLKCVAQVLVTKELASLSTPDATGIVQRSLTRATAAAVDLALLDVANAGTANVKPASITNGLTPLTATGDIGDDIGQALNAVSGGAPSKPVVILSLRTALRTTALRDLAAAGVRVIVSPAVGDTIVALDADGIVTVDEGVSIETGEPDVQMDDSPTTPGVAATVMVSSWQRGLVAIKVERYVNWTKRPDAVAVVTL